ncbi:23S rRNA (pseudouridine(1915)-N(3))-methyltransferase RlmH [Candidatus Saccharibacteria bacterium]|nr:23S rRNA (pseudouridine(1915)-N(3))-methyltransferase RlmH [Candidatus Saccharibacteria bacterium]
MKLTIISVGRKSSPEIAKLCAEYEKRLSSSFHIDWQLIEPIAGKMKRLEQRERESEKILSGISDSEFVILLDETGKRLNNHQLAASFSKWLGVAKNPIFVIGGAFGVSEKLKNRANVIWSLSDLVFPHEMVRVILVEQIYRTHSIINNLPYHNG